MSRHSSSTIEEKTENGQRDSTDGGSHETPLHGDLEKQLSKGTLGRITTRGSNTQAVPGVPLDEADFEGDAAQAGGEEDESEPRRSGGVLGMVDRVVSRASTKSSWNPGPPPDGGARAWMAGEWLLSLCGRRWDAYLGTNYELLQLLPLIWSF